MTPIQIILLILLLVVGFFIVCPVLISTIAKFTVQKRFAILMANKGIITNNEYYTIMRQQQMIGIWLSLLVLGGSLLFAQSQGTYGYLSLLAGFLLGLIKSGRLLKYNSLTVRAFLTTFSDVYDMDKMKEFLEETFDENDNFRE